MDAIRKSFFFLLMFIWCCNGDSNVTRDNLTIDCVQPSINDYPRDLFTQSQRQHGAIVFHLFFSIYLFIAILRLCDDYFIPSLEILGQRLGINEDILGATFMAGGSSAPEVFISLVGVFSSQTNIGIGTIVGSSIFNILFVIGLCAIFVNMSVNLSIWPFFRDSVFYIISIIILILSVKDNRVYWYESLIMICIYFVYLLMMSKNEQLRLFFARKIDFFDVERQKILAEYADINQKSGYTKFSEDDPTSNSLTDSNESLYNNQKKLNQNDSQTYQNGPDQNASNSNFTETNKIDLLSIPKIESFNDYLIAIKWIVFWPVNFILVYLIPDCRTERHQKYYLLTFLISILLMAIFSYFIVWMVTVIGYTFKIPDGIMSVTFLAAAASIPDAYSSVTVVRKGFVDMGVSNVFGSNVFDFLIGLALPWFIKAVFSDGYTPVNSNGLGYDSILLFTCVVFTIITIHLFKWQLNRRLGYLFLSVYVACLVFASAVELNVFSLVNLPMCHV